MGQFDTIKKSLVFTDHATERRFERSHISKNKIVKTIELGRFDFCGSGRFGAYYKGVKVVYKRDNRGNYVVISFYDMQKKRKMKSII